jgi:hypothetical protein
MTNIVNGQYITLECLYLSRVIVQSFRRRVFSYLAGQENPSGHGTKVFMAVISKYSQETLS